MFLRRATDFILQSRLQAMLVAFVAAVIPVIGSISIVIAALVTLRRGAVEGGLVVIAATLGSLLQSVVYPSSDKTGMAAAIIYILIASNILTWLFAVCLRKYQRWNFTLEVGVLIGIIVVIAVHIVNPHIQDWWQQQMNDYFSRVASVLGADKPDAETNAAQVELVVTIKRYATGFVIASILFNAWLQLLIARWWQGVIFNPGALRKELTQIKLGTVAGALFVAGLVLAYFGNTIALDVMPVLFIAFFVAGLSLVHYLVASVSLGWLLLALIYLAIIWLFPASIVIVALIALVDIVVDVRRRFNRLSS